MSFHVWSALLESAIVIDLGKSTLVFGAALVLLALARGRTARLRHTLATLGLLLGALTPLAGRLLPSFSATTLALPVREWVLAPSPEGSTKAAVSAETPASLAPEHGIALEPARLLGALWLLGGLVLLALRLRELARIRAQTHAAPHARHIEGRASLLGRSMGVHAVEVRISEEVTVPLTWGFRRQRILLPAAARAWPDSRLRTVLVHELVHARRRDYWVSWLVELVRAAWWFHPFVWWLARRCSEERELACDEEVLRRGISPIGYADTLLDVARSAHWRPETAGLAMARAHGLAERVRRILDPLPVHGGRRWAGAALTGGLLLLALGAAPWSTLTPSGAHASEVRERQHRAWTLGEREDAASLEHLIGLLGDPSPDVRAVAAWSLGEIKDRSSLPALYALLDDPDLYVREMALRAIGEHECSCSLGRIEAQLRAGEPALRVAAAWALGEIRTARASELLLSAIEDRSAAVRAQVLISLASASPGAVPERAWPAITDPDARVRRAACILFGAAGDARAVDPLLGVLRDPDGDVRAAATWALDEINPSRGTSATP
jgi:beta-lactamase regulating signal transducer with metallopeptidase domain